MSDSIDVRLLQQQYQKIASENETLRNGGREPPGGEGLEARVARLETHAEYIRRDLDDLKTDLKDVQSDLTSIKRGLAYLAGAGAVTLAVLAWIANNRFDQILALLAK